MEKLKTQELIDCNGGGIVFYITGALTAVFQIVSLFRMIKGR